MTQDAPSDETRTDVDLAYDTVRAYALSLPETTEEFPWGESAIKVRRKTVVFIWRNEDRLTLSLKLTASHDFALLHPFVNKMGQTLRTGGWIQCRFKQGDTIPVGLLKDWILQSYCAVAPKKLAAAIPQKSSNNNLVLA